MVNGKDAMLSRVGHIAVSWNEAERIINHILWLYLDTDVRTAEVLTKPMRPSDREKLLKELVRLKEIDPAVDEEIGEALRICGICRDNRNAILHNSGGLGEIFTEQAIEAVTSICIEFDDALIYLRALQESVTKVIYLRGARETPIGDESFMDEELPPIEFQKPERPKRPRRFNAQEVFQHAG